MRVKRTGREALFEERSAGGNFTLVLIFVAMRGDEVSAINRTIDGDFALCAAADGANLFTLRRAEAFVFSFFANWTRQKRSPGREPVGRILSAFENAKSVVLLRP